MNDTNCMWKYFWFPFSACEGVQFHCHVQYVILNESFHSITLILNENSWVVLGSLESQDMCWFFHSFYGT